MGRLHICSVLTLLLLVTCLLALPAPAGAEEDRGPWYSDVDGHWAGYYIYTLWDEDVLDGYPIFWVPEGVSTWAGCSRYAYFIPERVVLRGEFARMLAKVFRLQPLAPPPPPSTTFLAT